MDSSDSEDDCYGNIAQKLHSMKNKYTDDKINTSNLLDDSTEINEILKKAGENTHNVQEPVTEISENKTAVIDDPDDEFIEELIASRAKSSGRRTTRSAAKRAPPDGGTNDCPMPKKATRRKKNDATLNTVTVTNLSNSATLPVIVPAAASRSSLQPSRGRGRGRRGRNRGSNNLQAINTNLPIFSVGNTEEYPDQSDNQALFSTKIPNNDVVIIEDNEMLDENEELSVKVYWQSSEIVKFVIRKYQKFTQIFNYFSKKENVEHDKLLFTYNDRILKPDDTPDSIEYSIVKFIDGGIINRSVISNIVDNKCSERTKYGIKLKFQCQHIKKSFSTVVEKDEKLSTAMMKYAEHIETPLDKLKFEFDGDLLSGKNTPNELELEGGECIDVKIIS